MNASTEEKATTSEPITEEMIQAVAARFPKANIIRLPEENPKEVVFELYRDPANQYSLAVALISESKTHYHNVLREFYMVLEGEILLLIGWDKQQHLLSNKMGVYAMSEENSYAIFPSFQHSARAIGAPALVQVFSSPAWSERDHVLV